jgi:hypothetical protein
MTWRGKSSGNCAAARVLRAVGLAPAGGGAPVLREAYERRARCQRDVEACEYLRPPTTAPDGTRTSARNRP